MNVQLLLISAESVSKRSIWGVFQSLPCICRLCLVHDALILAAKPKLRVVTGRVWSGLFSPLSGLTFPSLPASCRCCSWVQHGNSDTFLVFLYFFLFFMASTAFCFFVAGERYHCYIFVCLLHHSIIDRPMIQILHMLTTEPSSFSSMSCFDCSVKSTENPEWNPREP